MHKRPSDVHDRPNRSARDPKKVWCSQCEHGDRSKEIYRIPVKNVQLLCFTVAVQRGGRYRSCRVTCSAHAATNLVPSEMRELLLYHASNAGTDPTIDARQLEDAALMEKEKKRYLRRSEDTLLQRFLR